MQNFLTEEYQFGLKFFKFKIKSLLETLNINLIPIETRFPLFYKNIESSINVFLKENKAFIAENNEKCFQKKIYQICIKNDIRNKNELNAKRIYDWKEIYSRIHHRDLPSNLRALNYKILLNGLPTDDKFNGEKSKCCFCQKKL